MTRPFSPDRRRLLRHLCGLSLTGGLLVARPVPAQAEEDLRQHWWICAGSECKPYTYAPEEGDPEQGVAPGTRFENLPDDWGCPVCGAAKIDFRPWRPRPAR